MRAGEREQATKVRMARVAWRAAAGRRWQEGESTPAASPVAKVHRAELAAVQQRARQLQPANGEGGLPVLMPIPSMVEQQSNMPAQCSSAQSTGCDADRLQCFGFKASRP